MLDNLMIAIAKGGDDLPHQNGDGSRWEEDPKRMKMADDG